MIKLRPVSSLLVSELLLSSKPLDLKVPDDAFSLDCDNCRLIQPQQAKIKRPWMKREIKSAHYRAVFIRNCAEWRG